MELPRRLSLLKLLARRQEVIAQLKNFNTHGQGSVLKGSGSLLGSAIHPLAWAISEGLRDTFHGVKDLDEKVLDSIANAMSNIIGQVPLEYHRS